LGFRLRAKYKPRHYNFAKAREGGVKRGG